ncbi:TetR/AcrR family transcriptional regulator [Numidum massiliense]|uniref:TetR/AcrR family transcriptional regulator n=1 Tax=Numidum massiliense TaxID=1522315 RepID=UPI0006D5520D|nr:TetR/AcrR family transcriptional regulator [Numidum massiliense]
MTPSKSKSEQKRAYILDRAQEVFIRRGYAATSMEDLVRHCEVSKGSIYYHFTSKETLFLALIERYLNAWVAEWKQKEARYPTVTEKLYGIAEHYVLDTQHPLLKVAEDFYMSQPAQKVRVKRQVLDIVLTPRQLYNAIFQEAEHVGLIAPGSAKNVAIVFASLIDGLNTIYYERTQEEKKQMYQQAVSYLLHGVLHKQ